MTNIYIVSSSRQINSSSRLHVAVDVVKTQHDGVLFYFSYYLFFQ